MVEVLIKGFGMPKSCHECIYHRWSNFWQRYVCSSVLGEHDPIFINGKEVKSTDVLRSGRSDRCPIVEIPPHGRLIDADALLKDVRKNSVAYFADYFANEFVDVAPTIIPADIGGVDNEKT